MAVEGDQGGYLNAREKVYPMKSMSLRGSRKGQSGFTLVEIAIVLVIIGLLLGGVLKGQELIEQSKIKRTVNDFNSISVAVMTYQDRYRFLPGDDPNAATRWTTSVAGGAAYAPPAGATAGNGIINGAVITNGVAAGESNAAWQHLRLAGLVNGDLSTVVRSLNPEPTPFGSGSNFAIVGAVAGTGLMGWGAGASGFCGSLPAKAAEQLDRQLDDGNPQGGNIRANAPNAAPNQAPVAAVAATANYVDSPAAPWYTVCKKF